MYRIPSYIALSGIDGLTLGYVWDDTRASEDLLPAPEQWIGRIDKLSVEAKVALGIGIYEWMVWRLHRHCQDPLPLQVAEAAWCASVEPARVEYIELDREDWTGPVRGPLWCAITWLMPMIFDGRDTPEELDSGTRYLLRLCLHILPETNEFLDWLDAIVPRLEESSTAEFEDPFDDLFGERAASAAHAVIAREVLDPAIAVQSIKMPSAALRILNEADPDNPLVHSAADARFALKRGPFRMDD